MKRGAAVLRLVGNGVERKGEAGRWTHGGRLRLVGGEDAAGAAGAAKRIVFLNHTAALGGGEIALLNTVRAMDRERFIPVVVLFAEGALAEKLRGAGIETRVLELDAAVGQTRKEAVGMGALLKGGKILAAGRFMGRLAKVLAGIGAGGGALQFAQGGCAGGLAAAWAGIPCVWHVRDRIAGDYLPGAAVVMMRRLARWVPGRVVANSAATLETLHLPGRYIRSGRGRVVHDGVAGEWKTQNSKLKTQNRNGEAEGGDRGADQCVEGAGCVFAGGGGGAEAV